MIFTLTIFQNNILEQYDITNASIEIIIMLFVSSLLGFLLGYFMSHRTKKEFVYNDVKNESSSKSSIEEKFIQAEKEASTSSDNEKVSEKKTTKKETDLKAETPKAKTKVESPKTTVKKTVAKTTVSNTKNDLKIIEGIGPGIEKLLNSKNINTYNELANTKIDVIQQFLNDGGPRFAMHSPETWPMQAQLLFENRMEDFKKLTEELKGGKIVK